MEGGYDSVAFLDFLHGWTHLVYDTTELVAEDVALLHFDDCTMEQVQVAAANCAAGDLEDDIAVFEDLWLGAGDYGDR